MATSAGAVAWAAEVRFAKAPFPPVAQITVPAAQKATPGYPRLDRNLNRLLEAADPVELAERTGLRLRDDRVQIHVFATPGSAESLLDWLSARGARHVSRLEELIQADVALADLRALAQRPDVQSVRRPSYVPVDPPGPEVVRATAAAGTYTSEALAAMNAAAWHAAGHTGEGVKVGIIDAGFTAWDTLLGNELPEASKTHARSFGGVALDGSNHGTGCAEIVHDVAPDAELYLAAVSTEVDIADAIAWMQSNGVGVITMSLGWLSWGPGDGTGYLVNAVNGFVNAGGVWANSAGNSRLAHWQGTFQDGNFNQFHEFAPGWEINYVTADGVNPATIPAGTTVNASLIWNQWSSPATDVDFFLYKYDGVNTPVPVASSEDEQSGQPGQRPVEEFVYETTEDAMYGFAIKIVSGPTNVEIEFFNRFDSSPLKFNVQEGSLTPPSDAAEAIATAALDAESPYALEDYSSKGPTNGPGGSLSGGRVKPDLAAYANVSGAAYGPRSGGGFGGTSAASPHVGGALALVRGAYPAYTGAQVRSFLEGRAIDMGAGGKDTDYGYGRLTLGTPPAAPCDAPATPAGINANPVAVSSGTSYTISWNAAANASSYELQEATNSGFTGATTVPVSGTSTQRSHTVASNTTYYYRVRAVRACTGSTAQSGFSSTVSVTVTGGSTAAESLWVPGAARLTGANNSQWRTDLGILNLGGATASCEVRYKSGATVKTYSLDVAAGRHVILRDAVGPSYLNGSGSGSLEVRSSAPVLVSSRTYNQNANGTFGQNYDSYPTTAGLSAGETGSLQQLTENAAYRCNIGMVNTGAVAASVTVTLHDGATGQQVGSYTVSLQPGEWKQENRPFSTKAGRNNLEAGYARVTVNSGSGVIAVASVVDNNVNSNDPTTITMQK